MLGELRFWRGKHDALIATQPSCFVDLARSDPSVAQIVFGADDEGHLALMQRLQSDEIEIAAVDDNNRTCWPMNQVEYIDVVHLAGGDMNENRNGPAQIDDDSYYWGRKWRIAARPVPAK